VVLCLTTEIDALARRITGRVDSVFAADVAAADEALHERIAGRRVLLVGAAGSIGSATLRQLLAYRPAHVTVFDTNENNLAELIRTLRSDPASAGLSLAVEPLDYGAPLAAQYLAAQEPFDLVLSFAALKHVRSERDRYSLLRMLEVNLLAADRFLAALRHHGHGRQGVFFVSTDKAANPVSLMGASKRVMESLLAAHAATDAPASLLDGGSAPPLPRVTTTRFANVAFSDGSLPWGFLQRLAKGQALAGPGDVRRFLVSPEEAGQLCLLASAVIPGQHIAVPLLDPERDSVDFMTIAEAVLAGRGLRPRWCSDEAETREPGPEGTWPVLVTRADTSGEKPMEEFVARDEVAVALGLERVEGVPLDAAPPLDDLSEVLQAIAAQLAAIRASGDKADLAGLLGRLIPDLAHSETGRSLDARM